MVYNTQDYWVFGLFPLSEPWIIEDETVTTHILNCFMTISNNGLCYY
jgi:hypothetical protein